MAVVFLHRARGSSAGAPSSGEAHSRFAQPLTDGAPSSAPDPSRAVAQRSAGSFSVACRWAVGIVVPVRPFRREDVVQGETLQQFREIVASSARQDFDAGVTSLTAGDFAKAEQSFKSAQRATSVNGNGTAPLTYLAATYAASGHDLEAMSVWQNALIDGSEYPQIYEWLADALVRTRNFDRARGILKEAVGKWPADARFTLRLSELSSPQNGNR